MNKCKMLVLCAISAPAMALASNAPIAVDASAASCSNIEWNSMFLADFPKAAAACRNVTVKDGVKFAQFDGKVSKVGHHFVQVEVSDVADLPISTIAFEIGTGGRITMGDKVVRVSDLKVGDQLTFWVREGQFGVSPTLIDQPMKIIKPESMGAS